MEEQIVNFDTAKLAKEKKFDGICYDTYDLRDKKLSNKYNIDLDEIYDEIDLKKEFECRFDDIFEGYCLAPTQSLLQKWLREVHKINLTVNFHQNTLKYSFNVFKNNQLMCSSILENLYFNAYEEALEVGLQEALKLIVI
jgi:hypothetical protein